MGIEYGPAKLLDEITLDDMLANPIWIWVWEEGLEGSSEEHPQQDETWQKPVLNTRNVTVGMFEPIIAIRVKGTEVCGAASYNQSEEKLVDISYWVNGTWQGLKENTVEPPIVLVAVPSIRGEADVEFESEYINSYEATRSSRPSWLRRLLSRLGW